MNEVVPGFNGVPHPLGHRLDGVLKHDGHTRRRCSKPNTTPTTYLEIMAVTWYLVYTLTNVSPRMCDTCIESCQHIRLWHFQPNQISNNTFWKNDLHLKTKYVEINWFLQNQICQNIFWKMILNMSKYVRISWFCKIKIVKMVFAKWFSFEKQNMWKLINHYNFKFWFGRLNVLLECPVERLLSTGCL